MVMQVLTRLLKWTAAAIAALVSICTVWATVFFVGFYYALSKYEQISCQDPRAVIEERKGLLSSRLVDPSILGGYQLVPTIQRAVSSPGNEIVVYSLFGAFFTVIYDDKGNCLAMIDNGLDG